MDNFKSESNKNSLPIEMADLIDRFGKDIENEFLYEIVEDSIRSIASHINTIKETGIDSDFSLVSRLIHSIKGIASNMAAIALSQKAATLENEVNNGNTGNISNAINEIKKDLDILKEYTAQTGWVENAREEI